MIFSLISIARFSNNPFLSSNGIHIMSGAAQIGSLYNKTLPNFDDPDWKNIRIKLNYSYITGNLRDPLTCYEDGQQIKIGSETITCNKNKVVSNMDLTNFTITMNNLKTFLESFLKVIPTPNQDYDFEYIIKLPQFKSSSSTTCQASVISFDKFHRPILSELEVNPSEIPKFVSEFETETSDFIIDLFRTSMIAFGANYHKYHHKNSTLFYSFKQSICSLTKNGKILNFQLDHIHIFLHESIMELTNLLVMTIHVHQALNYMVHFSKEVNSLQMLQ